MNKIIILIVCFVVPILMCLLLMRKKRSVWIMFCIGMFTFFISQIVLRMPILSYMTKQLSFSMFIMRSPLLYLLLLSFTAGLFEEGGRAISFRCTRTSHDHITDALAFGFGHGGIEAMLLVGLPLLQLDVPMGNALVASFERLVAMSAHVAFSLIVWWGIQKHQIRYVLIAMLLHTALNCLTGLPYGILAIEGALLLATIGIWVFTYEVVIKRGWKRDRLSKSI